MSGCLARAEILKVGPNCSKPVEAGDIRAMALGSPGTSMASWSASLAASSLSLEAFKRHGVESIPVALVPAGDGVIRAKNSKLLQEQLKLVSQHFMAISEVRQYGRAGLLCRSKDLDCVADLLRCTSFASVPVNAFIPPHLACAKGIVRDVDPTLSPEEVLEEFKMAGVTAVYRCSRVENGRRIPTASVIMTFAGLKCPSEVMAWPLVHRVDPLEPRPLQCRKCWRFGHTFRGCKSSLRCKKCGDSHDAQSCRSDIELCCLCKGAHEATYSNCPARSHESSLLEIMGKNRCSRYEASTLLKSRTQGYAAAIHKTNAAAEAAFPATITPLIEKSVTQAMQQVITPLTETLVTLTHITSLLATKLGCPLPVVPINHQAKGSAPETQLVTPSETHDTQAIAGCSSRNKTVSDSDWDSDDPVAPTGVRVVGNGEVTKDAPAVDIDDSYVMDVNDVSTTKILPTKQKRRISPIDEAKAARGKPASKKASPTTATNGTDLLGAIVASTVHESA